MCSMFYRFLVSLCTNFSKQKTQNCRKNTGLTNHIERLNNTIRQRVYRRVIRTPSFSKKLENYIGAIWNFIHYYNSAIREAISL